MRFFKTQEQAKGKTKWLVLSFVLATVAVVGCIVGAIELAFALIKVNPELQPQKYAQLMKTKYTVQILAFVTGVLTIAGTAIYQIISLKSGGGKKVAQMLGATEVTWSSRDFKEKQFVNVVQEMAIAAGIPMPKCYVMRNEMSINAFAAGWSVEDAIICVNRGTLEYLSRSELQGVIGHEMSHVLNADMKINIRAMAVIIGLLGLTIVGRVLFEIADGIRGKDSANIKIALFILGVIFFVLGWLGSIFGNMIAAAISRQREFLADASALQFTRNPEGIGGALRKIQAQMGTSEQEMHAAKANAVSHMFLSPALSKLNNGLFATHPPLEERIEKIYNKKVPPMKKGSLSVAPVEDNKETTVSPEQAITLAQSIGEMQKTLAVRQLKEFTNKDFNQELVESKPIKTINESIGLADVGHAALKHISKQMLDIIHKENGEGAIAGLISLMKQGTNPKDVRSYEKLNQVLNNNQLINKQIIIDFEILDKEISSLAHGWKLSLVDIIAPMLREKTKEQKKQIINLLTEIANIDGEVKVYEKALLEILTRRLLNTGYELSKMEKETIKNNSEEVARVIAWITNLSWEKPVSEKMYKALLKNNMSERKFLENFEFAKLLEKNVEKEEFNVLETLKSKEKEVLLAILMDVLNEEKPKAIEAVRLCCALMGVPVPAQQLY